VLAVYTSQLSSGIVGSLECIAFTGITGTPLLYPLVILAVLAGGGVFLVVLKYGDRWEDAILRRFQK